MKFYCTSSSTAYGQHWHNFEPRKGRHTGTGYSANFRPQVYYTPELDDLDNPTMKVLLSDNYDTVTKKHYRGYGRPSGHEPLTTIIKQNETGFIRDKGLSIPTKNQVRSMYLDTRSSSAPVDLLPRHRAVLHKTYPKDPIEEENYGYGPKYMSTEGQTKFAGQQPNAYSYLGNDHGKKRRVWFYSCH
jgi:protein phosphatase 1 regulatory subunit 32